MRLPVIAALLSATLPSAAHAQPAPPQAADPYWAIGRAELAERLRTAPNPRRARNVVLLVGDGMGVSTITAARIFAAQQAAKAKGAAALGEENSLSFERLPHMAMVKTYNTNAQVPDSAGTAAAMNMGVKTRIGVLNMLPGQSAADCANPSALPRTLAADAKARGMAVGVVTTTRITHATPAAVFAHSPNRNWEARDRAWAAKDRDNKCRDIAAQLVEWAPAGATSGLDVVLGGGRARFKPVAAGGTRDDGRDLPAEWRARFPAGAYVEEAAALRALNPSARGPVLGLFNDDHISYRHDRDPAVEPSLPEMAGFAVRKLQATGNPYYLMIEAGRIDHAHHAANPYRALDETVELSETVEAVRRLAGPDTLILVTADHSHVFTIAGYPARGNGILDCIRPVAGGESRVALSADGCALDDRGHPMQTLGYANGPLTTRINTPKGPVETSRALPPTDPNFTPDKLHLIDSETHGGEDVALFAGGPGSTLVTGVIEQNSIYHIMARALGWR